MIGRALGSYDQTRPEAFGAADRRPSCQSHRRVHLGGMQFVQKGEHRLSFGSVNPSADLEWGAGRLTRVHTLVLEAGYLLVERGLAHNPAAISAQKLSDFKIPVHRFASLLKFDWSFAAQP
jgi:hypothetical protein